MTVYMYVCMYVRVAGEEYSTAPPPVLPEDVGGDWKYVENGKTLLDMKAEERRDPYEEGMYEWLLTRMYVCMYVCVYVCMYE